MRIVASAALLLLTLAPAFADDSGGITVTGRGEVQVRPDIGVVSLGVQTQGPDAAKASADNAAAADRVIAAVKGAGVAEKDIQTAGYSLAPQYDYHPQQPGKPPTVVGYTVTNTVRATVRRVADVGKVVDAGVKAGANVASGIAFDLEDATAAAARDEATKKAVADAIHKAKVIAEAAGVSQTKLLGLSEGAVMVPRPQFQGIPRMRAMAAEAVETPVSPGETTVSAEVTARYAIGGAP